MKDKTKFGLKLVAIGLCYVSCGAAVGSITRIAVQNEKSLFSKTMVDVGGYLITTVVAMNLHKVLGMVPALSLDEFVE